MQVTAKLTGRGCCRWGMAALFFFANLASAACADEDSDDLEAFRPGLIGSYSMVSEATAGESDTDRPAVTFQRVDRELAFHWGSGPPDPRLTNGPYSVRWRGFLQSQARGTYRLFVHAAGEVVLKLNGETLIDARSDTPAWHAAKPIELPFDWHPIEIEYLPPRGVVNAGANGVAKIDANSTSEARLSFFWSGPQFGLEPITERQWFHNPSETPDDAFERGSRLARALRCGACHDRPDGPIKGATDRAIAGPSAAELSSPALDRLAGNIRREWLVEWLTQPAAEANRTPVDDRDRASINHADAASERDHANDRGAGTSEPNGETHGQLADSRRMPHFQFTRAEADDVGAFLLHASAAASEPSSGGASGASSKSNSPSGSKTESTKSAESKSPKAKPEKEKPPLGDELFLSTGCLACHRHGEHGSTGLFDGGPLSRVADKRPREFIDGWLLDPQKLNADHRMPKFELTDAERTAIVDWLTSDDANDAKRGGSKANGKVGATADADSNADGVSTNDANADAVRRGERLVAAAGCAACHRLPSGERATVPVEGDRGPLVTTSLGPESRWERSCATATREERERDDSSAGAVVRRQPRYVLSDDDADALRKFYSQRAGSMKPPGNENPPPVIAVALSQAESGRRLLDELNCLRCHARGANEGLAPILPGVAERHAKFAPQLPAMTPPSLNSVGDKLHDKALAAAIRRERVHRPYLMVRMPRFRLTDEDLQNVVAHLVAADRIPDDAPETNYTGSPAADGGEDRTPSGDPSISLVGARLVTTDGFGCTSCHRVGGVEPPPGPLNARGPDISMMGDWIRRPWYERWTRNPARIVPRMEMPSVQLPVRGVLEDRLDAQLAAVWQVLNEPGFRPPAPNPLRVVRRAGIAERDERAVLLTDVLRDGETTYLKPALIALPNRHNGLFDLERGRLVGWWIGDAARQRTEGKTWFWETGGKNLFAVAPPKFELAIVEANESLNSRRADVEDSNGDNRREPRLLVPRAVGQFVTELDRWRHEPHGAIAFSHRMTFVEGDRQGRGGQEDGRQEDGRQEDERQEDERQEDERQGDERGNDGRRYTVAVEQRWSPIWSELTRADGGSEEADGTSGAGGTGGWRRELTIRGVPDGWNARLYLAASELDKRSTQQIEDNDATNGETTADRAGEPVSFVLADSGRVRVNVVGESGAMRRAIRRDEHGAFVELAALVTQRRSKDATPPGNGRGKDGSDGSNGSESVEPVVHVALEYVCDLEVDQFPLIPPPFPAPPVEPMNVVPGFEAVQLPLANEFMPTGLAWRPNGELVVTSLKGRVWLVRDTDGDGMEDSAEPFSDELAAPYGAFAAGDYVDVINKQSLVRLYDDDRDGRADRTETIASGWGHTVDYHDWAVGLPSDGSGGYFIALPCQQDKRSEAAARHRGELLHLTPRTPTRDDPRPMTIRPVTAGHRFPMGIARRSDGELFVTDNQGNYNPFNELNRISPGARFGFINANERRDDFRPPLTPPAVNIPHPWTRSVNGICFLETPEPARRHLGRSAFGPFEGDLVGCEYDTRRLIRISVDEVDGDWQGAAYPFTFDAPREGEPLLGPIACAVSPGGDLFIGNLRDSGWGGSNNIGSLVRMRFDPDRLPAGIDEMRAMPDGFEIRFTREVDAELARDVARYSIESYTRVSTPAYGGPDVDRRKEKVRAAAVAADRRSVRLQLDELRPGFVYEMHLQPLVRQGEFFPDEAHYTLNRVPVRSNQ